MLTFVSMLGVEAMVQRLIVGWLVCVQAQGNGGKDVMASRMEWLFTS